MKKVTLLMMLMLCYVSTIAQVTKMTGQVLSDDDGQPVIGATVTVTGTDNRTMTDADGRFSLSNLTADDKTVTATYIGM